VKNKSKSKTKHDSKERKKSVSFKVYNATNIVDIKKMRMAKEY
jgi:hypothetical protein